MQRFNKRKRDNVPFFIKHLFGYMIQKNTVKALAEDFMMESENYLIDVLVSNSNRIRVFIENDKHVSIKDCIALSKHIESNLDREKDDFELEVSSPGIDQPFKTHRQYQKYLGEIVDVLLNNGEKYKGKLCAVSENQIEVILVNNISNKKLIQKSLKDNTKKSFPMNEIKETKLVIIL